MGMFITLFSTLVPLYILIALGWVAGRYFEVERQTLGALAIYVIMPVVVFGFITKLEFEPAYAVLPIVIYCVMSALSFFWLWVGQRVFKSKRANLLAMTAVSGNTGYMGLPIVLALFDTNWVAVYIFMMLAGIFHEATTMYYIASRSQFTVGESLRKLAKFPALYAVALALIVNTLGWDMTIEMDKYWTYFKGAYVVIGMMIIGAALSHVQRLTIAPRFLALTFLGKFALWPLCAYGLILIDENITHMFEPQIHKLLLVLSIVPPAANIAAFAVKLDLDPEQAATTILLGTIFALLYIPAMLMLFGVY